MYTKKSLQHQSNMNKSKEIYIAQYTSYS